LHVIYESVSLLDIIYGIFVKFAVCNSTVTLRHHPNRRHLLVPVISTVLPQSACHSLTI